MAASRDGDGLPVAGLLQKASRVWRRMSRMLDVQELLEVAAGGALELTGARGVAVQVEGDGGVIWAVGYAGMRSAFVDGGPAVGGVYRGNAGGGVSAIDLEVSGQQFGRVHIVRDPSEPGVEGSELLLSVFAEHVAAVVNNATIYEGMVEEAERRGMLEGLSRVGGVVFEGETGALHTVSDGAAALLSRLLKPGMAWDEAAQGIVYRRADGTMVSGRSEDFSGICIPGRK